MKFGSIDEKFLFILASFFVSCPTPPLNPHWGEGENASLADKLQKMVALNRRYDPNQMEL